MYTPQVDTNDPKGDSTVRFEAISDAWRLFTAQAGEWILITLIYFAISMALGIVADIFLFATGAIDFAHPDKFNAQSPAILIFDAVVTVLSVAASAYLQAGVLKTAIKQARGERIAVGDLFSAGNVYFKMLGAMLLFLLVIYGAAAVVMLPLALLLAKSALLAPLYLFIYGVLVLVLFAVLFLTLPAIVDTAMGPLSAMRFSLKKMGSQILPAIGVMIVLGGITLVGMIPCGLGCFVTLPLVWITWAVVYAGFSGFKPGNVQIEMPLPPQAPPPARFDV